MTSSVEQITGRLFDHERRRGGQVPLSRPKGRTRTAGRLARAAQSRPSAVFKLIKRGGTTSKAGFKGQMHYVFDKSERVIDPVNRFYGQDRLTGTQINAIAKDWQQDWWGRAQAGFTSHMLMSFPIGTPVEKVEEITRRVCNEVFQDGPVQYDYVAGVHTDRAHPHAHVILNRRGSDNRLFVMREGGEISYSVMRDAMVRHGEELGVYMEATSRFERGIVDRAPTVREVYAAREAGRVATPRPREGWDLDYAREQVAQVKDLYRSLGDLAVRSGCSRLHLDLMTAERPGALPAKEVADHVRQRQMDETHKLDATISTMGAAVDRFHAPAFGASAIERVQRERDYAEVLARVAKGMPDDPMARFLLAPADAASPYAEGVVQDCDALSHPDFVERIADHIADSGLKAGLVHARMQVGAPNDYLVQTWALADMQVIADRHGLDLCSESGAQEAQDRMNTVYAGLRGELRAVQHDLVSERNFGARDMSPPRLSPALSRAIEAVTARRVPPRGERDDVITALRRTLTRDELTQLARGKPDGLARITDQPRVRDYLTYQIAQDAALHGDSPLSQQQLNALRARAAEATTQEQRGHEPPGHDMV